MKRQWETEELIEHWTLHVKELALLGNKTGATRLGFAVLLKFFQKEARFPTYKNEVSGVVITYLVTQVQGPPEAYLQYDWQGRSIKDHRAQIREALGFREATVAHGEEVKAWLVEQVLPQEHQDERLREIVYQRYRDLKIEAPAPNRILRQIRSASHIFEQALSKICTATEKVIATLRGLIQKPDGVEMEFGFSLSAEAGVIIASASTQANYKVTLRWKGEAQETSS